MEYIRGRPYLQDILLICFVGGLSALPYIAGLGFYSDDWYYLEVLSGIGDASALTLLNPEVAPNTAMRPVHVLFLGPLFEIFGATPLPYHLATLIIHLTGVICFYLVLRQLGLARVFCISVPLVYFLLPHYSAARFWVSTTFQAVISMAFYFLSLYADLRAADTGQWRRRRWKILSLIGLAGGTLAYEVFIPLFFLNPLIVWGGAHWGHSSKRKVANRPKEKFLLYGSNIVMLVALIGFKISINQRPAVELDELPRHLVWYADFLKNAFLVSFGTYGISLWTVLRRIVTEYFDWFTLFVGGGTGAIVALYTYIVPENVSGALSEWRKMAGWIGAGLFVFGAGYAIFLTSRAVIVTPTGLGNRTAIAATIGVAIVFVGGVGLICSTLPARLRRGVFCLFLLFLTTSGTVVNGTLGTFWEQAYDRQKQILEQIQSAFPSMEAGSTLILDGACPYVGPGVVFDSGWDLTGALRVLYNDPSIQANIVTSRIVTQEDALATRRYGQIRERYPYSEKLFVYNVDTGAVQRLSNVSAARKYFEGKDPAFDNNCSPGAPGYGARVF